jgi:ribosomal protein L40E
MSFGWIVGGIAAVEEAAYIVWAGLVMATLGIVLCLYSAIESWKQDKEKKGGVPEVRSRNEWVCRNCGSQNKQEAIVCRHCGSSQQVTKKPSSTEVGRRGDNFCPNCGSTLPGGAKFCEECGARIEEYIPDSGPRTEEQDYPSPFSPRWAH